MFLDDEEKKSRNTYFLIDFPFTMFNFRRAVKESNISNRMLLFAENEINTAKQK